MPWEEVFSSDPWRRYVLQYYAAVHVRRAFLRARIALLAVEFIALNASQRVASDEYSQAADAYWEQYWFLVELRRTLNDEGDSLLLVARETQRLVFATNCLQRR